MIRRREESSSEEESACEAVFEFVLEVVFVALALVVVAVVRSRFWVEDCARRAARAVGERRPMPWVRRMRE